ncbi:four helix bundle protein [Cytophagales bacterium LB-30]|uniref:Four helix bundle protein n=1 Tax=Shiella aurantiaca TaxID=3058365 RepID=A0ABT8F5G3_9BACT|nr:four helix bundle protein [Shiella aurantiaca]MDN4165201.1 four helix bundle protein [Shiella aurantiaca]
MSKVERFEDLNCWKKSREVVSLIYQLTNAEPFSRDFDLRSQLRRCTVSVMTNIAEGFGRISKKEFIRFLDISLGSLSETKSLLYVAKDVGYLSESVRGDVYEQLEEIKRMILGLIVHLKKSL